MEKISVFVGSGFIGSRFVKKYKNSIIKIDRDSYQTQSNNILYLISTVDNYNVHYNLHIDIDTNLTVLMHVLNNLDKTDKNLVFNFVSSWFVYGKNDEIPFNEDLTICKPTGFYSITKRCAEQLLISFCETYDIKYRIFRLANVLGEGDKKISKQKNAMQFLLKETVNNCDVELYNGGTAKRDYIYVDDVCDAMYHCMEHAPVNEIINIGNGIPIELRQVIERVANLTKSSSKIITVSPSKFHKIVQVEHSCLDISKLKSYGFKNKFTIDDIIDLLINFYKNNINKN